MRVICAGFGRTGTASLKAAMEQLLDGPCYHFEEIFKRSEHRKAWSSFARGESEMDWKSLYAEYQATADFPSCAYYQELAEVYPDALVVLSVRDLESWADSWTGLWSYFRYFQWKPLGMLFPWVRDIVDILRTCVVQRALGGEVDRASVIAAHRAHIEKVKQVIPAERLLVYQVSEGWEPLCAALNVPVPDLPFPRNNPGNTPFIKRTLRKMFGFGWKDLAEG